ncbi:MAG: superoxide dismutase [Pseudonocardiales bacterium]|nr:MAG: superoxide dismutase [Pseudonocardiales bacterium]
MTLAVGGLSVTAATAAAAPTQGFALTAGVFASYTPEAQAITYDPTKVPLGSGVVVISVPDSSTGGTTILLAVTGLLPNHQYGAHAHKNPCGSKPENAGSHYQNVPDPIQPSVDPAYANSGNEIWLDFITDSDGDGIALTTVPWQFTDRHAHSVVIHAEHTMAKPGNAGKAGARLACVDVDF